MHINLNCSLEKWKKKSYGCSRSYSWKWGVWVHARITARLHVGNEENGTFFPCFFHFLRLSLCGFIQLLNNGGRKTNLLLIAAVTHEDSYFDVQLGIWK